MKRALDMGLVLLRRVVAAAEATASAGSAIARETISASVTTAAAENATAVGVPRLQWLKLVVIRIWKLLFCRNLVFSSLCLVSPVEPSHKKNCS